MEEGSKFRAAEDKKTTSSEEQGPSSVLAGRRREFKDKALRQGLTGSMPKAAPGLWADRHKPKQNKDMMGNGDIRSKLVKRLDQWNGCTSRIQEKDCPNMNRRTRPRGRLVMDRRASARARWPLYYVSKEVKSSSTTPDTRSEVDRRWVGRRSGLWFFFGKKGGSDVDVLLWTNDGLSV